MADFKELIKTITTAIEKFQGVVPAAQQKMLDRITEELAALDLKSGRIAISAKNVRLIAAIKAKLTAIILNDDYKAAVKDFTKAFAQVTNLQNVYFKQLETKFKPPKVSSALQKQAIQTTVENLTERGIGANVSAAVEDILRKAITSGGSIAELHRALANEITNNGSGDGSLQRFTKQITTDALNQHSAQYTQLVASDLGLKWYRYSGSNIETTRPWCLACRDKEWIHESEFPALLRGDFPEFEKYDGKLYKGLPAGMYADTTAANLPINRGGYNCGHQMRPVREDSVPAAVREQLKNPA